MSHAAITRADKHAHVLLGGMPGYVHQRAWVYLKKLYKHRRFKRDFDGVAVHPYAGDFKLVLKQLNHMRGVMKSHHDGHTGLWITELGWGSAHPTPSQPINQGRRGQKKLLRRAFPYLQRHRHRWRLSHLYWYKWRDPPPGSSGCTFCKSSGLFRYNQKPKPAWRTFKHILHRH
jgi:hypothetical protein